MLTITSGDLGTNLDGSGIRFLIRNFLIKKYFYSLLLAISRYGSKEKRCFKIAKKNNKTIRSRRDLNLDRQIQGLKC